MDWITEKLKKGWKWIFGLLIPVALAAPLVLPFSNECQTIKTRIENENYRVRRAVKSQQIPKCVNNGVYDDIQYGVRVEIQSIESIPDGIEVIARGWRNGQQVGFGKNGSVEWERFKIINPPILVPDGTKRSIPDPVFPGQTFLVDNFKEDPNEAIRSVIAHNIKVSGKPGTKIVLGSIGHTSLTVYPDGTNPGTTSMDGGVGDAEGCNSWANTRAGAGGLLETGTIIYAYINAVACSSPNWDVFWRVFTLFDTSAMGSGAVVTAATYSIYGATINDVFSLSIAAIKTAPNSNTDVVTGDYYRNSLPAGDGTRIATADIPVAAWTTSGYNDFTLNATGLAAIQPTGITKFGFITDKDLDNAPPTWAAKVGGARGYSANQAGTTNDPKLTITYTPGEAGGETDAFDDDFIF